MRLMKACLFSLAALFALSSLFLTLFLREEVRGDLVVQSLIHLKDFSVYFWGQDRYFSLVPLLLFWNRDPELGLYLTALLNATAFFAVPYLALLGKDLVESPSDALCAERSSSRVLSIFLLAGLCSFVFSGEELYFFVKDASPFPLSTALGFLSVTVWCVGLRRVGSSRKLVPGVVGVSCSAALAVVSLAVAPTTIGLSLAFLVYLGLGGRSFPRLGFRWLLRLIEVILPYLLISVFAWLLIQVADFFLKIPRLADYSMVGSLGLVMSSFKSLSVIWKERLHFESFPVFRLGLGASVALLGVLAPRGFAVKLRGHAAPSMGFCWVFWLYGIAALLVFSSMDWVAQNGFHFRYQYPIYLAWLVSAAVAIDSVLGFVGRRFSNAYIFLSYRRGIVLLLLALILGCSFRPSLHEARSIRELLPASRWMSRNSIVFVGGDYWSVWPAYLLSMADDSIPELESVAHRSSSNFASHDFIRAKVAALFANGKPAYLGCLGNTTEDSCSRQFMEVIRPVSGAVSYGKVPRVADQPSQLNVLSFSQSNGSS